MSVMLKVTNKLWSLERIAINLTLSNRFLVTGCTQKSFEVIICPYCLFD
jgi:hypothetical protein